MAGPSDLGARAFASSRMTVAPALTAPRSTFFAMLAGSSFMAACSSFRPETFCRSAIIESFTSQQGDDRVAFVLVNARLDVEDPSLVDGPIAGHDTRIGKQRLIAHGDLVRDFAGHALRAFQFAPRQWLDIGPDRGDIGPCQLRLAEAVLRNAAALDAQTVRQLPCAHRRHTVATLYGSSKPSMKGKGSILPRLIR